MYENLRESVLTFALLLCKVVDQVADQVMIKYKWTGRPNVAPSRLVKQQSAAFGLDVVGERESTCVCVYVCVYTLISCNFMYMCICTYDLMCIYIDTHTSYTSCKSAFACEQVNGMPHTSIGKIRLPSAGTDAFAAATASRAPGACLSLSRCPLTMYSYCTRLGRLIESAAPTETPLAIHDT